MVVVMMVMVVMVMMVMMTDGNDDDVDGVVDGGCALDIGDFVVGVVGGIVVGYADDDGYVGGGCFVDCVVVYDDEDDCGAGVVDYCVLLVLDRVLLFSVFFGG